MKPIVAVMFLALVLFGTGCERGAEPRPESEAPAPDRIVGLITEVDPVDGHAPESFTIEEENGDTHAVEIDPDHDYGFNLHHVYEHFEKELPVDVAVEERDGALVATSIEDV